MTDPVATIQLGDCRDIIAELPDCSVDSIVTDPPYELGFMGKRWDATGIAYDVELWRQCLRVLKPGGHLLAFGGTRTYHRMAVAIEDAGFEIRDSIHWLYGSGFPKSLNVSKAIGKLNDPATDAARQWEGWGTALKPAHEPIVVARKPLSGTVAATVLEHGTGALNIDGCRVDMGDEYDPTKVQRQQAVSGSGWSSMQGGIIGAEIPTYKPGGRWPANLVITHHADCADQCATGCPVAELDRQSGKSTAPNKTYTITKSGTGTMNRNDGGIFDADRSSLYVGYGDTGGASRYFTVTEWDQIADTVPFRYVAKPSRAERDAGLGELPEIETRGNYGDGLQDNRPHMPDGYTYKATARNTHPTVKPLALMRWLVRLVTPPDGTVLEPFAGSGTTMAAAILENRHVIGCELTADYLPIIKGRITWAHQERAATPPNLFDQAHNDD